MLNNILISKETRKVISKDNRFIGIEGENLQEILVFNLDEEIEGQGIIEVQFMDKTKGFIELEKTERGYELPVKSSLLTQSGSIEMQLRIIQEGQEIFKSEITTFLINEAINATTTIPEDYPTWIDNLEALKLNLENAEKERVKAEEGRIDAEKARVETFNQMGQAVDNAIGSIADLQEAYDKNAEEKTKDFDTHVVKQTENIDKHVEEKIKEYDEHTEELENRIIELETENENIKNQFPVGEEEGENITLTDSSDMPFKLFRPGGNSWQETRSGKNLLQPNILIEKTINGITFTPVLGSYGELLYININGTATALTDYEIRSSADRITFAPGIYKISGCPQASSNVILYGSANTLSNTFVDRGSGGQFTLSETSNVWTNIQVKSGAVINNLKCYPMIALESETDTTYEPYGAMPSPEFRSEIRNVGDNVNEFDSEDWYETLRAIDSDSMQKETVDGIEYYKFKAGGIYEHQYMKGKFEENTQYVISCNARQEKNTGHRSTGFVIAYTDETNSFNFIDITTDEYDYVVVTEKNKTIDHIRLKYDYNEFALVRNIKLEKGTKATPYSPYNCGNFNETVCNENFFDINNVEKGVYYDNEGKHSLANAFAGTVYVKGRDVVSLSIENKYASSIRKYIFLFDKDMNYLTSLEWGTSQEAGKKTVIRNRTIPSNAVYMTMSFLDINPNEIELSEAVEIMVEFKDTIPTYKPHQSQQFTFPLKPGQRMYKDSYLANDGVHHKRGQRVFVGTEDFSGLEKQGDSNIYRSICRNFNDINIYKPNTPYMSNKFVYIGNITESTVEGIGNTNTVGANRLFIFIDGSRLNSLDATGVKEYIADQYANGTPVIVEYELANEVIEPYTEEQQLVYNEIKKAHSYKNITHIFSTDEINPVLDVTYRKDLETMFNNINNAILGGN